MSAVIERRINLLAYLLDRKRPVTREEIRSRVEGYGDSTDQAFRRKFSRDKDSLRQIGFSLELRATDVWEVEVGYVIPDEPYRTIDPGLTEEERTALALAVHMVNAGGWPSGSNALLKLGGARLGESVRPFGADLGLESDLLDRVFKAVLERRRLTFLYRNKPRTITPYGVCHRSGHWYFAGADMGGDGKVRTYRLDRTDQVKVVGPAGAFERPRGFSARDIISSQPWERGAEHRTARVRWDPEVAWWAESRFPNSAPVERFDDGSLVLDIPYSDPESFIDAVLEIDAAAVISEPSDLRRMLIQKVKGDS